ncbi:putative F-box/kelch-repeat protein At2g29810 [Eutrema salsugineum]|uniref:putative F-box/kelch-repeat protein At2g29810 n=1 Tax=Eutrema salsugineum TaxID=72664 RepID=UPI000CED3C0F|nr:putative F-box/kelch-repeat protein At2g29810 [Eutrema salsugineum]
MVVISEIPDDGDPNKKPQEEEVQHNLPTSFAEIPNDIIETCIATRVRRCHYPELSRTSRFFHGLMKETRLYEKRSSLGLAESVLYALIRSPPHDPPSWYILHGNNNSRRLCRINLDRAMPLGCAVVTIGPEIYVIGGSVGQNMRTSGVFLIDCRFHRSCSLPSMRMDRYGAAAGVIDGKIYVIGGCEDRPLPYDCVEVFDVKTQVWEMCGLNLASETKFVAYVVMEEKIYVLDAQKCFAFEPRERKWQHWLKRPWYRPCCVVDDLLYTIRVRGLDGLPILYDPKKKSWRPAGAVDGLPCLVYNESEMANLGGKLVILGTSEQDLWIEAEKEAVKEAHLWCVEIALERREDGEVWGNVESATLVLTSDISPSIELCRTVTI